MPLQIISMEGFDDFLSSNPTFDPLNLSVDEELRAKGILPFENYTGTRIPKSIITRASGKSLAFRSIFNGALLGEGAIPDDLPSKVGEILQFSIPSDHPVLSDNGSFKQILSLRVRPTIFALCEVSFDGGVSSSPVSICPLIALGGAADGSGIGVFPSILYAVETGGFLIATEHGERWQNVPDPVTGKTRGVILKSMTPGVIGATQWNTARWISFCKISSTNAVLYESGSVGVLGTLDTPFGLSFFGVFAFMGTASHRAHRFLNSQPDLSVGDKVFQWEIDDICMWAIESTAPSQAAPNTFVKPFALQTVITNTGVQFGPGTVPEGLGSFDGDDSGVGLVGTQEVSLSTVAPDIANGQIFGLEVTTLMAAPNGAFDVETKIIVPSDAPDDETVFTDNIPDSTFRMFRNIVTARPVSGDPFGQAALDELVIKVNGT